MPQQFQSGYDYFQSNFWNHQGTPPPKQWDNAKVKQPMIISINDDAWKLQYADEILFTRSNDTLRVELPGFHVEYFSCAQLEREINLSSVSNDDLLHVIYHHLIDTAQFPYPVYELKSQAL